MGAAIRPFAFKNPPRDESAEVLLSCPGLMWLQTQTGGQTPAVHMKMLGSNFTLLYLHGNATDLGQGLDDLALVAHMCNASVFAVEYPGYSISEAWWPTEGLMYEAVEAAYNYLKDQLLLEPALIVPFGDSLGTAAAVHVAASHHEIQGLVLLSPLQSGCHIFGVEALPHIAYGIDPFKSYEKIERVEALTCIVHGTDDDVVPVSNGQGLYSALERRGKAATPLWIEGAGHDDMPLQVVLCHVHAFLDSLQRRTSHYSRAHSRHSRAFLNE